MKKITLMLLMSFVFQFVQAQTSFEGFEGPVFPPAGWTIYDNGVGLANSWVRSNAVTTPPSVFEGTWAAYMNGRENIGSGNTAQDWLVTPQFVVPTNGQLRFYARSTIAGNQGTIYQVRISTDADPSNLAAYTVLEEWNENQLSDVFDIYQEQVVGLGAFAGQNVHIAFVLVLAQPTTSLTGDRWFLDNVSILEQCLDLTALTAAPVLSTTATLGWTDPNGATAWEIEYGPQGFAQGTGTVVEADSNPFTISGLNPATQYSFYVRAVCSADNSSPWAGPSNFTTQAAPPECGGNFVDNGGIAGNYLPNSDVTVTICPDNPGDLVTVTFISFATEANWDALYVFDGPGITSPQISSGNPAGFVPGGLPGGFWGTVIPGPFTSSSPDGCLTFRFRSDGSVQLAGWVANVTCAPAPTCPRPTAVAISNVQESTAIATWTDTSGSDEWHVLALPCGSPEPDETTTGWTSTTSNPHTLTGLNDSTCYDFYVRSVCDDTSEVSLWAPAVTFNTTQIPVTLNYFEGFEGAHGWVLGNGTQTNKWIVGSAVSNGGTQSLYITNDNGVSNAFTINATSVVHAYRDILIPADAAEITLSYDWRAVGESCCDYLRVWLAPAGYTPTPGTLTTVANSGGAQQLGANFNMNANWQTQNFTIPVGAFAGQVRRLIFEWRNDGSIGTQPPAAVDNINLTVLTCPAPNTLTASGITMEQATLGWNEIGTATSWEVLVLPSGSPTPTPGSEGTITTNNPYVATGLTSGTAYVYYVRSVCDVDDLSLWSGPFAFNTPICDPSEQCLYSFVMTDSFGDGWNGNTMTIAQNGITIAVIGSTFTTGTGPVTVQVPLCNGVPYTLFWNSGGSFAGEVGISVQNTFGQTLFTKPPGTGTQNSLLYTGLADCDNPECLPPTNLVVNNIGIDQVTIGWNGPGATEWEVIAVPSGSPAPGADTPGTATTDNPFTITGLTPGTSYDFYVRTLCDGDNPTSLWAGPVSATTLPTCPQPINLTIVGTTPNSVEIGWTEQGFATQWEIVIQSVGTGVPTSPGIITSNNPITISGLANGFYEYYVRAICDASDISAWSGPDSFYIPDELDACAAVEIDIETSTPGLLNVCPDDNTVSLSASFLNTGETTNYEVQPLDFSPPFPFTGGIQTSVNTDDVWSPTINLPFSFCFFGENYNNILVGSNGVLTFSIAGLVPGGNQNPGGGCAWSFNQPIPNATFPIRNAIYGVYQDINPNVTTPPAQPNINYQVLGSAPCRVFVVNFSEVAQFSCGVSVGLQTSQIVLYETSNIIEVYIQNRTPCLTWNNGNGLVGIQNQAGSQAHTPPGRNTGSWSASNEAWRFVPAGDSNVAFSWLLNGDFYSNDLDITVTVEDAATMTAQAIYTSCVGEQTVTTSDIIIQVLSDELDVQDDVVTCSSYALPDLIFGNYFTGPEGTGTQLAPGTEIDTSTTIYVYAEVQSSSGTCSSEGSFEIIIEDYIVDELEDVSICDAYILPELELGSYYTGPGGTGDQLNAGDVITSSQTIYIYASEGDCEGESSFEVIVGTLVLTPISDFSVCDSYELPVLSIGDYYTGIAGSGDLLPAGTLITSTQLIYVYASQGSCEDEISFTVTVNSITADEFEDVDACDSYILPELSSNNSYYTGPGGSGAMLEAGALITESQTVYVYASTGTDPDCTDESSFAITITETPLLSEIADVTVCDVYTLPSLSLGGYFTGPNGQGPLAFGTDITASQLIYVYASEGVCFDEVSFTVNIVSVSVPTFEDVEICDEYLLPELSSGSYFTGPNGSGSMLPSGTVLTESQTVYIYASSQGCTAESSFEVIINTCLIQRGISPNNDGLNDFFDLTGFNVEKLSIFNRYGMKVYSRNNYVNEWGGQSDNGNELPDGTYYYVISRANGQTHTGWIYINRERN